MAITSTEMWSKQTSSCTIDSAGRRIWQLKRGWLVHGATTVTEALTATPLDGRPIAQLNDPHAERPASTVRGYENPEWRGPMTCVVIANYDVPPFGNWNDVENPLSQPIQISPDWMVSDRELEVDFNDTPVPVVNSAGVFFEPGTGPTTQQADPGWVFARNEPTYPVVKVLSLYGTTNDAPFALPGIGTIDTGQGWIGKITNDSYAIGALYVRMSYAIYCRKDGWRSRTRDWSYQGWAVGTSGPELGYFCDEQGVKVSTPVMLDGSGFPVYDDSLYVKISNGIKEPVNNPTAVVPSEYLDQPGGDYGPTFIKFKRFAPASWAGLF